MRESDWGLRHTDDRRVRKSDYSRLYGERMDSSHRTATKGRRGRAPKGVRTGHSVRFPDDHHVKYVEMADVLGIPFSDYVVMQMALAHREYMPEWIVRQLQSNQQSLLTEDELLELYRATPRGGKPSEQPHQSVRFPSDQYKSFRATAEMLGIPFGHYVVAHMAWCHGEPLPAAIAGELADLQRADLVELYHSVSQQGPVPDWLRDKLSGPQQQLQLGA